MIPVNEFAFVGSESAEIAKVSIAWKAFSKDCRPGRPNHCVGCVPFFGRTVAVDPIPRQRWEAQREQWRREEEARRAAKALKDSKEDLLQVIDAWAEAKRLDAFFADAERRAQDLPDEQRERTIERLRRARALSGSTDALERFNGWRAPEER